MDISVYIFWTNMTDLMEYHGTWRNPRVLPERSYEGYNFDVLVSMFIEKVNKPSVSVLWFTGVKP